MSGWRRPTWWAVLLTAAGALLFACLGVWQLHRADEKEALLRRYAAALAAPPVALSVAAGRAPGEGYARVGVRGEFLADRRYLLDNPRHDSRGGVEVYVPLRMPGQPRLLLVDLGLLPGQGGEARPDLPALPSGEQLLQGVYLPPPGHALEMGGDALPGQARWPKTTVYLDLGQLAADLGQPLFPRVLALEPEPASPYQRSTPDFAAMPPSRHRAYAFQWFVFAAAAVVIFVLRHRSRRGGDGEGTP
ncbi:SURF1 family protein [Frateuria defendens]|uniref:SURF1 family protein n=1 Tax=Frateuria defendens TaxID=2219559 RepID=UPI00066FE19C|nr:SURF1 family protein [Frateuria defendens]